MLKVLRNIGFFVLGVLICPVLAYLSAYLIHCFRQFLNLKGVMPGIFYVISFVFPAVLLIVQIKRNKSFAFGIAMSLVLFIAAHFFIYPRGLQGRLKSAEEQNTQAIPSQ